MFDFEVSQESFPLPRWDPAYHRFGRAGARKDLDFVEIAADTLRIWRHNTKHKPVDMFELIDSTGDGVITIGELWAWLCLVNPDDEGESDGKKKKRKKKKKKKKKRDESEGGSEKLARVIDDVAAEELMDRYDTTGDGAWHLNDFFMCVLQGKVNKELHNQRMRRASMDVRAAGQRFSGIESAKKRGRGSDDAKKDQEPEKRKKLTKRQRRREARMRKAERRRRNFFASLTLDKCALVVRVGKARHLPGRGVAGAGNFRTYCKLSISCLVPDGKGGEKRDELVLRSDVLKGTSNPDFADTGANAVFVVGGSDLITVKRGKGELEFDYSKSEGRSGEAAASAPALGGAIGLDKIISVTLELKEKNSMIGATSLGQCEIEYESLLGSEQAVTSDYVLKVDGVAKPSAEGFQKQISITTALAALNPPPALLTDEDFDDDDDDGGGGEYEDENAEKDSDDKKLKISPEQIKELSVVELRRHIHARGEEAPVAAQREEIERVLQALL